MSERILKELSGGDLRSEGNAEEVAGKVIKDKKLLEELRAGLKSDEKVLRARACMALEIISRTHSELLNKLLGELINLASTDKIPQIRWHISEILSNVELSDNEKEIVIPILIEYLGDKSKIVKYCAIQALGVVGRGSAEREDIIREISAYKDESKSMKKIIEKSVDKLSH